MFHYDTPRKEWISDDDIQIPLNSKQKILRTYKALPKINKSFEKQSTTPKYQKKLKSKFVRECCQIGICNKKHQELNQLLDNYSKMKINSFDQIKHLNDKKRNPQNQSINKNRLSRYESIGPQISKQVRILNNKKIILQKIKGPQTFFSTDLKQTQHKIVRRQHRSFVLPQTSEQQSIKISQVYSLTTKKNSAENHKSRQTQQNKVTNLKPNFQTEEGFTTEEGKYKRFHTLPQGQFYIEEEDDQDELDSKWKKNPKIVKRKMLEDISSQAIAYKNQQITKQGKKQSKVEKIMKNTIDAQTQYVAAKSIQNQITQTLQPIIKQNLDEETQYVEMKSIQNQIIQTQSIISKQSIQIAVQVNRTSPKLKQSMITQDNNNNTYFSELIRKEDVYRSRLRSSDLRSLNTSTSNTAFKIPDKSEIFKFIENYKPIDIAFDLKELMKERTFNIVPYKNAIYIGEYQNKKRQGLGILITEKSIFEGQFKDNNKFKGSERNGDGIYKGTFVNGLRQGNGQFLWFNGQNYTGQWKLGMKHGTGIWKSANGDFYEGDWTNNRQEGRGVHLHQGGIYKGEFLNFLKHGKGQETFNNKDTYVGQYMNGKPHGLGEYKWNNGSKYTGSFIKGVRQGHGILESEDSIYKAEQDLLLMIKRTDQVKQFTKMVRYTQENLKIINPQAQENSVTLTEKRYFLSLEFEYFRILSQIFISHYHLFKVNPETMLGILSPSIIVTFSVNADTP